MQTQTRSGHCQGWVSLLFDLNTRQYAQNTNVGYTRGWNKEKTLWSVRGGASVGRNWVWDLILPSLFSLPIIFVTLQLRTNSESSTTFRKTFFFFCFPFRVVWFKGRTKGSEAWHEVFVAARLYFCLLPMLAPHRWSSRPWLILPPGCITARVQQESLPSTSAGSMQGEILMTDSSKARDTS